jgi:type I restriction enzyme, S subunit
LKTIEKAATKSRVKAKHADSPTTQSAHPEPVEGFVPLSTVVALNPRKFTLPITDDDIVSFVPMKSVEEETGNLDATTLRPWHEVKKGYTAFQDNDVIFAKITPCMENGKFAIARGLKGGRAAGSTEFHVLRPDERLSPHYLMHFLFQHHIRQDARMNMRGAAGQLRVPTDFLESLKIPLPPLPTQHRIVAEIEEKLSRLDAAQSALLRAQANLKRYRASILAQACDGSLLGADSSTWLSTTLGALATKIRNGFSAKPDADHGTRIFRISAVRPLALGLDEVRYLSGDIAEYSAFTVEPGDLLFTRYNGNSEFVGACAVVPLGCPPTVYPDKLIKVQLPKAKVIPEFAAIQASSGITRSFIESRIRTTAGQSGISGSDIKATPILLTAIKIQHQIVEEVERRLSVIDRTEQTLRTQLERAKRLRQSILQQAFSPPLERRV